MVPINAHLATPANGNVPFSFIASINKNIFSTSLIFFYLKYKFVF